MTRLCYDSTNILDIPTSAPLVGYYVDGIYAASPAAIAARFPKSVPVPISAIGTNVGTVGDVEPGCIWPVAAAVPWVVKRRAAGVDPTIYCNQWNSWSQVRQAFQKARVREPYYWVANYDGVAVIPAGAVAKQYANPTLTGHHYDLSVCVDNWPGVDGLHGGSGGTQTGDDMTPDEHNLLVAVAQSLGVANRGDKALVDLQTNVSNMKKEIEALQPSQGGALPPQLVADIATIAALARKLGLP